MTNIIRSVSVKGSDVFELIEQGKIKRYFRASKKLVGADLVSHITQRAAGKEPLFLEETDYLYMLAVMKNISKKYELKIFAFCLMPNHVHLLLSPTEPNLSDAMRDLFSRYASRFNRRYERKGHLFGSPYRQAVCFDDSYLLGVSLYIHLNPVRARIAEDPMSYRWSSCRLYCDDKAPSAFVDPHFVLGLFSEDTLQSKKSYRELLTKGTGLELQEILEEKNALERLREMLLKGFPSLILDAVKNRKVNQLSRIDLSSMEDLEVQIKRIKAKLLPGGVETRKAKTYLIEQLLARGFTRQEIAEKLGISRKTVYNILNINS